MHLRFALTTADTPDSRLDREAYCLCVLQAICDLDHVTMLHSRLGFRNMLDRIMNHLNVMYTNTNFAGCEKHHPQGSVKYMAFGW